MNTAEKLDADHLQQMDYELTYWGDWCNRGFESLTYPSTSMSTAGAKGKERAAYKKPRGIPVRDENDNIIYYEKMKAHGVETRNHSKHHFKTPTNERAERINEAVMELCKLDERVGRCIVLYYAWGHNLSQVAKAFNKFNSKSKKYGDNKWATRHIDKGLEILHNMLIYT